MWPILLCRDCVRVSLPASLAGFGCMSCWWKMTMATWHCNHCGNETGILYEFNDLHVGKTWKGWDKLGKSWGKLCRVLTKKRLVGRLERGKIGRTWWKVGSFDSSPSHPQVLQYSPNLPQLFIQIFPTSSPKVFWKSSGSLPPTFL